jgi:long-chain fatty acid transport protein
MSAFVAVGAFAGGFQLNEHGARAMAQAGAFAARASDPSAIYFNPAGIAFQDQPAFYGGVTAIIPTSSFFGPLNLNTNAKTEAPSQFFNPINAYITYPVLPDLHVAVAVNNPYGLGSKWPDNWVGQTLTTEVNLQSFFFTGAVSYKVLDNLSVAGSVSYVTGSVTLDRTVLLPVSPNTKAHLDLKGNNIGWSFGALYKISPDYSVGASYHSAVKIDASGSATFTPYYTVLGLPQGDVSASLELPATAFVGFAWTPADKPYQIEADYQYIGWASYDQLAFTFKANNSQLIQPKNYNNTYILRIGGEYTIGDIHLRGGYLYDHSPVDDQHVDPILPDADRDGINLGFGYDFSKNFSVDVAYMLLLFKERQATGTDFLFDGTYQTHVNLFGVNVGYTF